MKGDINMVKKVKKVTEVSAVREAVFEKLTVFSRKEEKGFQLVKKSLESKGVKVRVVENKLSIAVYVDKEQYDKYLAKLNARRLKVAV